MASTQMSGTWTRMRRRPRSSPSSTSAGEDDEHMSDVRELLATDETFREVADLLFGGGGDELIAKMNPTQSDVATHERKKRAITAGLSAVGATAGAAGLGLAAHKTGGAYRAARAAQKASFAFHAPGARRAAAKTAIKGEKLATGLIPLEVAGLGGEVMATRILHGDTKKKIAKGDTLDMLNQAGKSMPTKGQL